MNRTRVLASVWRLLVRALQLFLAAAAVFGVVTSQSDLILNAAIGLGLMLAPVLLERRRGVQIPPSLVAWLAAAASLHVAGMAFGLYWPPRGYDDLTHAVSGSVLAALGYVGMAVWERRDDGVAIPAAFGVGLTLLVVVAGGVLWEVLEFAVSRGVQLSLLDTLSDLVYNLSGGAVAVALARPYLERVADDVAGDIGEQDGDGATEATPAGDPASEPSR